MFSTNGQSVDSPYQWAVSSKPGTYAAAQASRLKRAPKVSLRHEDDALPQRDRDKLATVTWDNTRNFELAGWAIRKHCDFVAEQNFTPQNGDATLDDDLTGIVDEMEDAENFDLRGKLGFSDYMRTSESCIQVGGDMLIQRHKSAKAQAIESDRIRNPPDAGDRWRNGVRTNRFGKPTHFSIHRRTGGGGFEFERILKAEDVIHYGVFQRHDQTRGVTQLSAALNHLEQVGTGIDYALGRALISQLWGLYKKTDDPSQSRISLSGGPFIAEIGLDEELGSISDRNPSAEFDSFVRHVISIAMKSLDLPYNFYDASHSNFFGSRAAVLLYLQSCKPKRRRVRRCRNDLTRWRFNHAVATGRLRLPRSITVDDLKFAWLPSGMPWWNPGQEASANEKLLNLNLRTHAEIRAETHGDSWDDMMRIREAEEIKIKQSKKRIADA